MKIRRILLILVLMFGFIALIGCDITDKKDEKKDDKGDVVELTNEEKLEILQDVDLFELKSLYATAEIDIEHNTPFVKSTIKGNAGLFVDITDREAPVAFTELNLELDLPEAKTAGRVKGHLYLLDQKLYADLDLNLAEGGTEVQLKSKEVMNVPDDDYISVLFIVYTMIDSILEMQDEELGELEDVVDLTEVLDLITVYRKDEKTTIEISVTKADFVKLLESELLEEEDLEDITISDDAKALISVVLNDKKIVEVTFEINGEVSFMEKHVNPETGLEEPGLESVKVAVKLSLKADGSKPTLPTEADLDEYSVVDKLSFIDLLD